MSVVVLAWVGALEVSFTRHPRTRMQSNDLLIAGGNLGAFGLGIGGGCGVGFGLGWGVGFGCGSKYIDQNFVFEETKGRRVKKELPQV